MKFYAKKWKSVYVPQVLAIGEGPATWEAYFNQQMRWAYGLFDILFHHTPKIVRKMKIKHAFNYLVLQQHYFDGLAQVISIILMMLYFTLGLKAIEMNLFYLLVFYIPVLAIQQLIFLYLQKFYYIDKKSERGFLLKGRLLTIAAWPIYFLALLCVIRGKKLNYKVTPKGSGQKCDVKFIVFLPHFILGSITALGIGISYYTDYNAWHLIILALVNTFTMFLFIGIELVKSLKGFLKQIIFNLNGVFRKAKIVYE